MTSIGDSSRQENEHEDAAERRSASNPARQSRADHVEANHPAGWAHLVETILADPKMFRRLIVLMLVTGALLTGLAPLIGEILDHLK